MGGIYVRFKETVHPIWIGTLKPVESTMNSKLKYIGTHELLSISFIGSEESNADFIPVEGTTEQALDVMMTKMNELRKKYLPEVLMKHDKKHGNVSKGEKLWIRSIEELGRNIEQNKRIGQYNVDGFDKESTTVYEFNGCFFHGCIKCYKQDDINPLTGDTMNILYEKIAKKEAALKQMGYKIKSIWG
ncbi:hypothetical protein BATDEDRAFT_92045 [Batrachochytrium dendrobatidis JAM81]|uniref:Uncharacterized protein n=1 Tax=Batrachochytrium dendrobatidis (strain JAM81 / FGSC 10211) TaxID=684364 RepID=F4PCE3_BATDJ|nr:uncharacterized protein BATDEDRAFT_92045 [Batrachochytrium dendrobatidis JAM81]EGF77072.1 hypothetical protein BATDEDRAFT_92045 [Batrachochytrium dendrobatidis JAM81]|eukprot:XP_006682261.1 hypothetical protein BATDEDRAFT_92045 [Batrachochytrium dendrobatidis JAM81]